MLKLLLLLSKFPRKTAVISYFRLFEARLLSPIFQVYKDNFIPGIRKNIQSYYNCPFKVYLTVITVIHFIFILSCVVFCMMSFPIFSVLYQNCSLIFGDHPVTMFLMPVAIYFWFLLMMTMQLYLLNVSERMCASVYNEVDILICLQSFCLTIYFAFWHRLFLILFFWFLFL